MSSNIIINNIQNQIQNIEYKNTIFEHLFDNDNNNHLLPNLNHSKLIFNINNTKNSFVNAIRRCIIDELYIKNLNFDLVDLYTDDKFILPDLIQNRIGLIPIIQTINENTLFNLYVQNNTLDMIYIYSNDIITKDKKEYFNNNIILCDLKPNKTLKIDNIKIKIEQGLNDGRSSIGNSYFEVIDFDMNNNQTLNSKPHKFKFTIDSNGNINPIDILHLSIDNLINRLNNIHNLIHNNNNNLIITMQNNITYYHINNEYHTLGNLLVDYIYDIEPNIKLVDYNVEHPTKNKVIISILHNDPNKLLLLAIQSIIIDLQKVKEFQI